VTSSGLSKERKFWGVCVADALNVRKYAGKEYSILQSIPMIYYGQEVEVLDTVKANDGKEWYYIRINGTTYGFASAEYIVKK